MNTARHISHEVVLIYDETVEYIEDIKKRFKIPIVYVEQKRVEPFNYPRALNAGIQVSKGEYILVMNEDVQPQYSYLEKMIASERRHTPCLVGPRTRMGGCSNPDQQGEGVERLTKYTLILFAILLRRDFYDKLGPFDERFDGYGCDDDDYSLRCILAGRSLVISDGFINHDVGGCFHNDAVRTLLPIGKQKFIEKWGVPIPVPPREHWFDDVRGTLTTKTLAGKNPVNVGSIEGIEGIDDLAVNTPNLWVRGR
jgi:glycosyltransferase involved in cell wall biosynthesis